MRLSEITQPDPEHAELALQVADVYRKLYERPLDMLRANPPAGGEIVPRHRAIVFPARELVGEAVLRDVVERSPTFRRVRDFLSRHGWTVDAKSYAANLARRKERRVLPDTPRVRRQGLVPGTVVERTREQTIASILQGIAETAESPAEAREARELLTAFQNDPARRGAAHGRRGDEPVVVVSFDPVEAAHMTAGRSWQSCWRIGGAGESEFRRALRCGIATVWITTRDDVTGGRWLDAPTARYLLAPYVVRARGGSFAVAFRPVLHRYNVYGSPPPWADSAVEEAARRIGKSLRAAVGTREALATWRGARTGMPERLVTAPADTPEERAAVGLYLAVRSGEWRRLPVGDLKQADTRGLAEALERLARDRTIARIARPLARMLRGQRPPDSLAFVMAALALAATGHLPREALPEPERVPPAAAHEVFRDLGGAVQGRYRTPADLWTGTDRVLAYMIEDLAGGERMPDDLVPDRDTAIRLLERVAASPYLGERLRHAAEIALEVLRTGRFGGRAASDAEELAARILARGTEDPDELAALAVAFPEAFAQRLSSGGMPEEIRGLGEAALVLDGWYTHHRIPVEEVPDRLVRAAGSPAEVPALLRRLVAVAEEAGADLRPHVGAARYLLQLLDGRVHLDRPWESDLALGFLARGVMRVDAALSLPPRDLFRAGGDIPIDRLPLPVVVAALFQAAVPRAWEAAVRRLRREPYAAVLDALRVVARRAREDLATEARDVLAAIEKGTETRGSRIVPLIGLVAAGHADPDVLRRVREPDVLRMPPSVFADLDREAARVLADVIDPARLPPATLARGDPATACAFARRARERGAEIDWTGLASRTVDLPLLPVLAVCYDPEGRRVPPEVVPRTARGLAAALLATRGKITPLVRRWIETFARAVREAVERRETYRLRGMTRDMPARGSAEHRLLARALPRDVLETLEIAAGEPPRPA